MFRLLTATAIGIIIGAAVTFFFSNHKTVKDEKTPQQKGESVQLKYPLKATLYRFEINKGKKKEFDKWMQWHHDEYAAIIETMEREKMYSEAIFTDSVNQPGVLYWLTIDGEGGAHVDTSPLKVYSVHNAYMKATITKGSRSELTTEFYLIPDFLKQSIAEHQENEK